MEKDEIMWSTGPANSEEENTCLHNEPEYAIHEFLEDLDKHEYPDFVNLYGFVEVQGRSKKKMEVKKIYKNEVCIKVMRKNA